MNTRDHVPTPFPASAPPPGPCVARVERRAKRLHDMIARLDVDPARFARLERGRIYADARKKCLTCASATDCLSWLDHEAPEANAACPPEFCPNRESFLRAAKMDAEPTPNMPAPVR